MFSRTNPKLAVFSHIAELSDATHPPPGDDEIVRRTRANWGGGLIVGTDLTRFTLTPGNVAVQRFDPARGFVFTP